jgi:hypothetical protein
MQVHYDPAFLQDVKDKKFDPVFTDVEWPKLEQAAQVHGYRGASKKNHNGIVPIRPSDSGLLKTLSKLLKTSSFQPLLIKEKALPIKVVAHVPTGNRLVGYRVRNCIYILGAANYSD